MSSSNIFLESVKDDPLISLNDTSDLTRMAYSNNSSDIPLRNSSLTDRFESDTFINTKESFESNNSRINDLNEEIRELKMKCREIYEKDEMIQALRTECETLKKSLEDYEKSKGENNYLRKEQVRLKDEINTLEALPGRLHQSVAEASYDAWIKYYRKNEHSPNSSISYYNKGHLLGLLLDIKIIAATQGKSNLDDVMLKLYKQFALKQKGYTSDDVRKVCESVSGLKLTTFFEDYVFGVEPLPYVEVFALAGLDMDSTTEKSSYHGAVLKNQAGRIMITSVVESSPAWDAGLNVKDELVAIDGFRVKSSSPDYFREKVPGDRIICTVSRNGILKDLHLTVGFKPSSITELKQIKEPSEIQKVVFEKWLGLPWDEE